MQQLQAYRASTIVAMTAAAILVFTGLASAQAQSAERASMEAQRCKSRPRRFALSSVTGRLSGCSISA